MTVLLLDPCAITSSRRRPAALPGGVFGAPAEQFLFVEEQRSADLRGLRESRHAPHVGVDRSALNAEQVGGFVCCQKVLDIHTQYDRLSLVTLSGIKEVESAAQISVPAAPHHRPTAGTRPHIRLRPRGLQRRTTHSEGRPRGGRAVAEDQRTIQAADHRGEADAGACVAFERPGRSDAASPARPGQGIPELLRLPVRQAQGAEGRRTLHAIAARQADRPARADTRERIPRLQAGEDVNHTTRGAAS